MEMTLTKLDLTNIWERAKVLKAERLWIVDDMVYGTDSRLSTLKALNLGFTTNIEISAMHKDLRAFISSNTEFIYNTETNTITGDVSTLEYEWYYIPRFKYMIDYVATAIGVIGGFIPTVKQYNLKEDQAFKDILASNTVDGVKPVIIEGEYLMYLSTSILPVNKSDSCILDIFDNAYDRSKFLGRFTIHKKSVGNIYVYINFLKLF